VLKTTRGVGVAESPAYGLEWECAFPTEKKSNFPLEMEYFGHFQWY